MTDETRTGTTAAELYQETYRPQFHFTPPKNWINDPNGLVYYAGEYHLFFQHNPFSTEWGHMTWGHAVSRDLIHWQSLPDALQPDAFGTMFSGSAVVDWENTAGFAAGAEKTLVTIYTAAGGTSPDSQGQPFTQCLAYSKDRGRTWTKFADNPVLPHIVNENRDPKVIWHAPTRRWIMALYLDGSDFALFASPDLKAWTRLQTLMLPGCSECPDFFPLAVEDEPGAPKWVFTAANGHYLVGDFDGRLFLPMTGPRPSDLGANFYAVQTYSDLPAEDGRRIQLAWMAGGRYPEMPFNQQMSFPCRLTLRRSPNGLDLCRTPIEEIDRLVEQEWQWTDLTLSPGDDPLTKLSGELWDIAMEFAPGKAEAVELAIRGETIHYNVLEQTLSCLERSASLPADAGKVRLRVLADRASLELFGNDGQVSLTSCFLPTPEDRSLSLRVRGGDATFLSLRVRALCSIWPQT